VVALAVSHHDSQTRKSQLGTFHRAAPALATQFELKVRQLQLTPEMYVSSRELRLRCPTAADDLLFFLFGDRIIWANYLTGLTLRGPFISY
jgi:hypothetical protein